MDWSSTHVIFKSKNGFRRYQGEDYALIYYRMYQHVDAYDAFTVASRGMVS